MDQDLATRPKGRRKEGAEEVSRLGAYYELTKPGIAGYVMITAGVGY